jgi:hypothetical protein
MLGRRKIEIGNLFYARRKNSLKMRDLFFARDNIDLELDFLLNLGGHPVKLRENKAIQQFHFPPTVENKTGRLSNPASLRPCTPNAL